MPISPTTDAHAARADARHDLARQCDTIQRGKVDLIPNTTLRIATWNLARPAPTGVAQMLCSNTIAVIDADVWILTETRVELSPGLGYHRAAHSKLSPDRTHEECWTAIWVRDDIESTSVETSDGKRAACARLVFHGGHAMIVFGTVLPWLNDRSKLPLKGADAFVAELSVQLPDWHRLRLANADTPFCVAGDLNQDLLPSGHYYGSAKGRAALRAEMKECELTCLTGDTWDPIARERQGLASIDHICLAGVPFANPSSDAPPFPLRVWPSHELVGPRLSDHRGVAVDLPVSFDLLS